MHSGLNIIFTVEWNGICQVPPSESKFFGPHVRKLHLCGPYGPDIFFSVPLDCGLHSQSELVFVRYSENPPFGLFLKKLVFLIQIILSRVQ